MFVNQDKHRPTLAMNRGVFTFDDKNNNISLDWLGPTSIRPILGAGNAIFETPLRFPDLLLVGARVSHAGTDEYMMEQVITMTARCC